VRVAVLGLTVPMVTARMKVAALSAYLFDPPLETRAPVGCNACA
jgi:hypothetical protein